MMRLIGSTMLLALLVPAAARAQDGNILQKAAEIEAMLREQRFEVTQMNGSRFTGDRTQRVTLLFDDSARIAAKWARAAPGGEAWNNVPRYELAAYELQKLMFDQPEFTVPPTVIRAMPLEWYRRLDAQAAPTFDGTASVLVVLQYWLWNVTGDDVFQPKRLDSDTVYARYFANANVLTYLIRHSDSNIGNLLISNDPSRPRVFSVDNGVAFSTLDSDRGTAWRNIRVKRLPRATVERLRAITTDDLARALGVLAEYEIAGDGGLVAVPAGANLEPRKGVRRADHRIQLGLTEGEISAVADRLRRLIERVDAGKIPVF